MIKIIILLLLISYHCMGQCGRLDIVILADYSGSMEGHERSVVSAISDFVASFATSDDVRIGIIAFNSEAEVVLPPTSIQQLQSGIDRLRHKVAVSTTRLDKALVKVRKQFDDDYARRRVTVVITDGVPDNKDTSLLAGEMLILDGVFICGIYISSDYHQEDGSIFLNQLTRGCYLASDFKTLGQQLKRLNLCL